MTKCFTMSLQKRGVYEDTFSKCFFLNMLEYTIWIMDMDMVCILFCLFRFVTLTIQCDVVRTG